MSDTADSIVIVRETERTRPQIRPVVAAAFGRSEEADLVDALREAGGLLLSLVAITDDERVVGHIGFSPMTLETSGRRKGFTARGVSLAPVAVLPEWQNKKIGHRLCEIGLTQIRADGHDFCALLGHPTYYPRFGFQRAFDLGFTVDVPVPDEHRDAFMILELRYNALSGRRGKICHHPAFGMFV